MQTPQDIEEFFARMAPPETPAEAFRLVPQFRPLLAKLDPAFALATLAGLMTDISFQPHGIRLDWAARSVVAASRGGRRLFRKTLQTVLNTHLTEARVARLEDPVEDFFSQPLRTSWGNFSIFQGHWEGAAACTELILAAFCRLPDGDPKEQTLNQVLALLRLSQALSERAKVSRGDVGDERIPSAPIDIPREKRLRVLRRVVCFSRLDLAALGVDLISLAPFLLDIDKAHSVADSFPGDSPLEFRPLILLGDAVMVAAPANISTAVRALLVHTAVEGGMRQSLAVRLQEQQGLFVQESAFTRVRGQSRFVADDCIVRQHIDSPSTGRYIHVLQVTDTFSHWPEHAFGGQLPHSPEASAAILKFIQAAKQFIQGKADFVDGATLLLVGGWGRPRALAWNTIDDWLVIPIETHNAAVLGACEDGALPDIWRLNKQLDLLASQGFEFTAANGLLNLFQWWRDTDHALVPPGEIDIAPPVLMNFDTNRLLKARREAEVVLDRRAIQHPHDGFKFAVRFEHRPHGGAFQPIYITVESVLAGTMLGVVVGDSTTWWVELVNSATRAAGANAYETWLAACKWLARIGPLFPYSESNEPALILLDVEPFVSPTKQVPDNLEGRDTIDVSLDHARRTCVVRIRKEWQWQLHHPTNKAEVELATQLALALARLQNWPIDRSEAETLARRAAGSDDVRYRHLFQANSAADRLASLAVQVRFRKIPVSAGALAKCGTAWATRPRAAGPRIRGKAECISFLTEHAEHVLSDLRRQVTAFERRALVAAGVEALQGAAREQRQWELTARAQRGILGNDLDREVSQKTDLLANGVIRGASIVAELAACEARGTRLVGTMDVDELLAQAMLYFHSVDMLAAMHGDRIEPIINISPAGDVLYDHSFGRQTLQHIAERLHTKVRSRAVDAYVERYDHRPPTSQPDKAFLEVVEAEFGVDAESLANLPLAIAELVMQRGESAIIGRRSAVIREIENSSRIDGRNLAAVIDRLTLPPRSSWDSVPSGSARADFDLGKFDRRWSLIARPIVALSAGEDPELVVAPALIERTIHHSFEGALSGSLQNDFWQSPQMRKFASDKGRRTGLEFNERVSENLQRLGLRAWPSAHLSWCLNRKATEELKRLGDIDVLAVSPSGRCIWVIEAKDLKLCRTLGEVARRLSEYRGRINAKGKPDSLMRHLRRVEFVRANARNLVGRLGLSDAPRTVCGLVVVRAPQPMQNVSVVESSDGRFVLLDELEEIPWDLGWQS